MPSSLRIPSLLPPLVLAALLLAALACGEADPTLFSARPAATDSVALGEPIHPLPPAPELDSGRLALGRRLFHDPRLSENGATACATCHPLASGGADGLRFSLRASGSPAPVNTPTVLNAALHFRWSWNGRAGTLEEQVEIAGHEEMGLRSAEMTARIAADPTYRRAFEETYGRPPDPEALIDALVVFQRSLLTPSRFDRHLAGDEGALSAAERDGYALFKSLGCAACHQGVGVGGNMFQRFGVLGDYFADRGDPTEADLGRFAVTGRDEDRHVFKVPSLRNVALTAPYFHDGSAATLDDAIRVMARYQLGRDLADEEVAGLAAFLGSLTGDRPAGGAG